MEGRRYNRCIVHVVLSKRTEMIGMTVREADFIGRFNAGMKVFAKVVFDILTLFILQN